ncbi:hypothetical protein [Hyphomicrobium sp. LHD-15]|uniref:hypothetical protein n=1 Tax=Hyphomicrobium sp. LHD-15 TaxID=3072142 RepID=UPI00281038C5|nr:hypothetical protein [Hyphomicrobium sp. LHD-15]MDQ8697749.1 hypothetical protein [Hyphomicrobium sp. LHD-15]
MYTKSLALASALTAMLALTSVAEAGGGVRLGFGGPLGTFVATPAQGGSAGYQKQAIPKKRAPVQQARHIDKPAPRVAKAEPAKVVAPKADSKIEPAKEGESRVTGSSALIQGSVPVEETETVTPQPASDVKAEASSTSNTVTAATSDAPQTCKKFIPAIGTTVSVGCNE